MMRLLCFGFGYTAAALARHSFLAGWRVAGTCREAGKADALHVRGMEAYTFHPVADENSEHPALVRALQASTHVLLSAPPQEAGGDPVLSVFREHLISAPCVRWVGYLSTTGVYGDHGGAWVDERTSVAPPNVRSRRRVEAERDWMMLYERYGTPVHIFRLSGIYGPGRSAFDAIQEGRARRIDKPGQVFCRIHVEDIAEALAASMVSPTPGEIYNLADSEPAPAHAVTAYACRLAGVEAPPLVPWEDAGLSPMAYSFYQNNRRVSGEKIRAALGLKLRYPTYREGLQAIWETECADRNTEEDSTGAVVSG